MSQDKLVHSKDKNVGSFIVHRALPTLQVRNVGPFVFLDHMGPVNIDGAHPADVGPHPHIGLATVTYLFEGSSFHRDSLGSAQEIKSGDLNWMTAGRGIVHSERTSKSQTLHGVQIWVALPVSDEDCEPSFVHWPKEKLPEIGISKNLNGKLLIGEFNGQKSPVKTLSRTLYLDFKCDGKISETLSFTEREVGIFLVAGKGKINGQNVETDDLFVPKESSNINLEFDEASRMIVIGGTPHPEPRHMWWNFVSSSKAKIKNAAEMWEGQKLGKVPTETDYIPLPSEYNFDISKG